MNTVHMDAAPVMNGHNTGSAGHIGHGGSDMSRQRGWSNGRACEDHCSTQRSTECGLCVQRQYSGAHGGNDCHVDGRSVGGMYSGSSELAGDGDWSHPCRVWGVDRAGWSCALLCDYEVRRAMPQLSVSYVADRSGRVEGRTGLQALLPDPRRLGSESRCMVTGGAL